MAGWAGAGGISEVAGETAIDACQAFPVVRVVYARYRQGNLLLSGRRNPGKCQ